MRSRNGKLLNSQYPEIIEAFREQPEEFIVHGESVAFKEGVPSFSKLQKPMHRKKPDRSIPVCYYAFDLIHLTGYQLIGIPLRIRKSMLEDTLDFSSKTLRHTPHRNAVGKEYFKEACRRGWEGLVAKDADAEYVQGRSRKWLKFKCGSRQELVICNYTDPKGERNDFGALLVGFYKNGNLHYAGKVGTGCDEETLERIYGMIKSLEQNEQPFDTEKLKRKGDIHWLKPELVGEFRFSGWTNSNNLRHPSFLGLRYDKKAENVTKERMNHRQNKE